MDAKVNESVKHYADAFLAVLTRIANALEARAGTQPIKFTGHEIATNLTPDEFRHGNSFFPGTDKIAATMNQCVDAGPAPAAIDAPAQPADNTPLVAYDTVRKAILAYQDAKGAHAAQSILKQFGAKYIMDLKADPSKYAAVLKALQ